MDTKLPEHDITEAPPLITAMSPQTAVLPLSAVSSFTAVASNALYPAIPIGGASAFNPVAKATDNTSVNLLAATTLISNGGFVPTGSLTLAGATALSTSPYLIGNPSIPLSATSAQAQANTATKPTSVGFTVQTGIMSSGGSIEADVFELTTTTSYLASHTVNYSNSVPMSVIAGLTLNSQSNHTFSYSMSGGIHLAGQAVKQATYNTSMSGGTHLAGQAVEQARYVVKMAGGVLTSGHGVQRGNFSIVMAGGVRMGGRAATQPTLNCVMTGGVHTGGITTVKPTLKCTMAGGVHMGGSVPAPTIHLAYVMTGGLVISGRARIQREYTYYGSGCIGHIGGKSGNGIGLSVGYHYRPEFPNNRIYIYGKASYSRNSYSFTMTGGVQVGGNYTSDFCSNTCNLNDPFYRSMELLQGCQKILDTGKIDYVCAKMSLVYPIDTIRAVRSPAYVPAATVCLQRLYVKKKKEVNCAPVIRK